MNAWDSFLKQQNVSRETIEKLNTYQALLIKWQKAINLVSPNSIPEAETRHFLDSAQLLPLLPSKPFKLVDMGCGAGFPGLVLAMLRPDIDVHLVESDQRKCIFMQNVSRETNTPVTVHNQRIEETKIDQVDIVSARALSALDTLLSYASRFSPNEMIFLKGEKYKKEIKEAEQNWGFEYETHKSLTDTKGAICHITNLIKK